MFAKKNIRVEGFNTPQDADFLKSPIRPRLPGLLITGKGAAGLFCLFVFFFPSFLSAQNSPSVPVEAAASALRSFDSIFPALTEERKQQAFAEGGLVRALEKNEVLEFIPAPDSGIDLPERIMGKKPGYLAESLLVIPYSGKALSVLDAYNALGKVRGLKGRLYHSHTRNAEVPLFEDATRLQSAGITNPLPDPPPAEAVPASETVYIRLKDVNFGNCYYRGEAAPGEHGLRYSLTNYKKFTYLFFTVMKEERFSAILYLEPLAEGMMVYSVAGADASNFIASKIDIPSAISKRLAVFIGWVSDGMKTAQEGGL